MDGFIHGTITVCVYFIIAATTALVLRRLIRIPDELFRKILHFILLFSYIPFTFSFDKWWHSALLAVMLEVIIYPLVLLAEKLPSFSSFMTERKKGEFKQSLLLAFSMLAICTTVCRGIFGDRYLVLVCMYSWGVGDAFAALAGKKFGKHKITWKYADNKKSIEGSLAMLLSSMAAVLAVLYARGGISGAGCFVIAFSSSAVATVVEMISHNGNDTIFCPAAAMCVAIPLTAIFGGF